jgi:hypothetical protein
MDNVMSLGGVDLLKLGLTGARTGVATAAS